MKLSLTLSTAALAGVALLRSASPLCAQGAPALPPATAQPTSPFVAPPPVITGTGDAPTPPPLATTPSGGVVTAPAPPVISGGNESGGGVFTDAEQRSLNARRAAELSVNGDPNVARTYRNTDNLPLRTLLLILAKQANIPYLEPDFRQETLTSLYSPVPILPLDAFKSVARHNGYYVNVDANGLYTLSRSDITTPGYYSLSTYQLHHLQPPYALLSVAQALGFTIEKPGALIQTYAAPAGGGGGGSSGGGGGGSDLVSGSGSSSDEQVQPRYTPGMPMDTPVSRRKDPGGEARIFIDRARRSIILFDTEANQQLCQRLLVEIDRLEPQIRLETQVVQVNETNERNSGFDWSSSLGQGISFNFTPGVSSKGIGNFFFYPTAGVFTYPQISTTLKALETRGLVRTINHTWTTMRQGVTTPISDTTEESVVLQSGFTGSTNVNTGSGGSSSAGNGLSSTSQIEKYHYGVTFDAFCWLGDDNTVHVNLNPQVSTKIGVTQTSQGPIPIISRQKTTQDVTVKSGHTFCFGGIVRKNQGRTDIQVPVLERFPILGPLFFKSRNKTNDFGTLVYLITPVIIRPNEYPQLQTNSTDAAFVDEFNAQRPTFVEGNTRTYTADGKNSVQPVRAKTYLAQPRVKLPNQ